MVLGGLTLACGGSAFTGVTDDTETGGSGGAAGSSSSAGRRTGGSSGKGGKTSTGGGATGGSETAGGSAGASATGGAAPTAGQPGVAGGMTEPTPDTTCPSSAPSAGGACKEGLTCSYGTDVRLDCRTRATCDGGHWTLFDPDCKQLPTCTSDVSAGNNCDMDEAVCVKDDSQYCQCSACIGMVCGTEATWHCTSSSSSAGCPKLAPNQGQPCEGERKCQYGACGLGQVSQAEASCDGRTWSYEMVPCPL
jgi:hypothetical protein